MTDLLDKIMVDIALRMEQLRPAVKEVAVLESTLAALNGEDRQEDPRLATLKQRARKRAQRRHHNNDQQHVAYLSSEQVDEMQKEARRKKIGLKRLMERHGYVNDGTGWRQG